MDMSEAVGQGLGRVLIPVVLFLWGMHRCQALAESPTANAHAVRGLVFALGAWVLMLLHSAFAPMLPWQLTLVALAGVVLLGSIGAVRSVRGLIRWSDFEHGNVHGVLGLLIGLGLSGLVVVGFVSGLTRS